MYGLDHQRLRSGGRALLEGEGELGAALFEASAGVRSIPALLERLDESARQHFVKSGKKGRINEALRSYEEHHRTLRDAVVLPRHWAELQRRHEAAAGELDAVEARRRERSAALSLVKELRAVAPLLGAVDQASATLAELAGAPLLAPDCGIERTAAETALAQARLDARLAAEEAARQQAVLAAVRSEPALLDAAAAIERFGAAAESVSVLRTDLAQAGAEAAAAQTEIDAVAAHIDADDRQRRCAGEGAFGDGAGGGRGGAAARREGGAGARTPSRLAGVPRRPPKARRIDVTEAGLPSHRGAHGAARRGAGCCAARRRAGPPRRAADARSTPHGAQPRPRWRRSARPTLRRSAACSRCSTPRSTPRSAGAMRSRHGRRTCASGCARWPRRRPNAAPSATTCSPPAPCRRATRCSPRASGATMPGGAGAGASPQVRRPMPTPNGSPKPASRPSRPPTGWSTSWRATAAVRRSCRPVCTAWRSSNATSRCASANSLPSATRNATPRRIGRSACRPPACRRSSRRRCANGRRGWPRRARPTRRWPTGCANAAAARRRSPARPVRCARRSSPPAWPRRRPTPGCGRCSRWPPASSRISGSASSAATPPPASAASENSVASEWLAREADLQQRLDAARSRRPGRCSAACCCRQRRHPPWHAPGWTSSRGCAPLPPRSMPRCGGWRAAATRCRRCRSRRRASPRASANPRPATTISGSRPTGWRPGWRRPAAPPPTAALAAAGA